jgi:Calcium-binding EGF domain
MLHPADLDECLNGELEERPVCTERGRERCVNTEGSFRCVAACRPGYRPLDIEERLDDDSEDNPEDDDHGCVDIDECVGGNHTCTLAEKLDSFAFPNLKIFDV